MSEWRHARETYLTNRCDGPDVNLQSGCLLYRVVITVPPEHTSVCVCNFLGNSNPILASNIHTVRLLTIYVQSPGLGCFSKHSYAGLGAFKLFNLVRYLICYLA